MLLHVAADSPLGMIGIDFVRVTRADAVQIGLGLFVIKPLELRHVERSFHEKTVGFLYLKQTGKDTVELAVMGVLKEYHRHGIGKALFEYAKSSIKESGYSFIQVKTVQMGKYEEYDHTNQFYISLGFKEFEVFPMLWDEWNPCQVYVMAV